MKQTIKGKVPSKSNGYKIGPRGLYKSAELVKYESTFFLQCHLYRDMNLKKEFHFYADVFYPSNRSDLDGMFKITLDILQKKVKAFTNDNLCTRIVANKFVDKDNPRIEFEIIPV